MRFNRNVRTGFTFYLTGIHFMLIIPFVGSLTNATNDLVIEKLFMGTRYGFSFASEYISIYWRGTRISWSFMDTLLGKADEKISNLGPSETFITSEGRFVLQRQARWKQRRWIISKYRVGYLVVSCPFDLGYLNFFLNDNPMGVVQNCRGVAELNRETKESLRAELERHGRKV